MMYKSHLLNGSFGLLAFLQLLLAITIESRYRGGSSGNSGRSSANAAISRTERSGANFTWWEILLMILGSILAPVMFLYCLGHCVSLASHCALYIIGQRETSTFLNANIDDADLDCPKQTVQEAITIESKSRGGSSGSSGRSSAYSASSRSGRSGGNFAWWEILLIIFGGVLGPVMTIYYCALCLSMSLTANCATYCIAQDGSDKPNIYNDANLGCPKQMVQEDWQPVYPDHPLPPSQRGDTGFRYSSSGRGPPILRPLTGYLAASPKLSFQST